MVVQLHADRTGIMSIDHASAGQAVLYIQPALGFDKAHVTLRNLRVNQGVDGSAADISGAAKDKAFDPAGDRASRNYNIHRRIQIQTRIVRMRSRGHLCARI